MDKVDRNLESDPANLADVASIPQHFSLEETFVLVEQAKREWEVTVDSLPQLICLLDFQKRIIRANQTVEKWGLAPVTQVKGQELHHLLHPNCPAMACYLETFLNRAWSNLRLGQGAEIEAEDRILDRYLYLQIRPLSTQSRFKKIETSFAALIIQDITERKRMEEILWTANEVLEQRVEERTAQLLRVAQENARLYEAQREQYHRLQASQAALIRVEKMAALGRLMASIAHEINNPLQSIQGFLSLMEEELDTGRQLNKLSYYLNITTEETDRIAAIIRRMRDFYHLDSYDQWSLETLQDFCHSTQTELQLVNVDTILESVLELTSKKLQHSNIMVERIWADPILPQIRANSDHLKQVFLNLILNAIDTMQPHQGGRLRICTSLDQIALQGEQLQPVVRIEFSDSGTGMSPEVLSRLFEPLFTTKEYGAGFGLFTSYKIIEAHHGQITATSEVGQGTTFTIFLQVQPPS